VKANQVPKRRRRGCERERTEPRRMWKGRRRRRTIKLGRAKCWAATVRWQGGGSASWDISRFIRHDTAKQYLPYHQTEGRRCEQTAPGPYKETVIGRGQQGFNAVVANKNHT
jgi:hypothetical protein